MRRRGTGATGEDLGTRGRKIDAFAGVRLGDGIIGAVERRLAPLASAGER